MMLPLTSTPWQIPLGPQALRFDNLLYHLYRTIQILIRGPLIQLLDSCFPDTTLDVLSALQS